MFHSWPGNNLLLLLLVCVGLSMHFLCMHFFAQATAAAAAAGLKTNKKLLEPNVGCNNCMRVVYVCTTLD